MKTKTILFGATVLSLTLFSFGSVDKKAKIEHLENGNITLNNVAFSDEDWETLNSLAAGGFIFRKTINKNKEAEQVTEELATTKQEEETTISFATMQKIDRILAKYE